MKKLLLFVFFAVCIVANGEEKKFTVVLDPGHGGSDPGAVRYGIFESKINLDIALLVGDLIKKNNPDIDVVFTRKTDIKLQENERMRRANAGNGDIFVSIHVNSAYNSKSKKDVTTIHGVEVYIQTVENSDRKTRTLKEKGSVTTVGENGKETESRLDSSNPVFNAIYEIKQAQIYNLSNNLATYIRNSMGSEERNIRGVKQKSLYVTWQTTMPSVLVEVGYITNTEERAFMNSKEGQTILATGLYNGILEFKKDFDLSRQSLAKAENADKNVEADEDKGTNNDKNASDSKLNTEQKNEDEVIWAYQIFVTSSPLEEDDERFNNLQCSFYKEGNLYKYIYGSNSSYNEVLKLRDEVKKLFKDAFIVALKNGKRIEVQAEKR